jgi:hypothetical protein
MSSHPPVYLNSFFNAYADMPFEILMARAFVEMSRAFNFSESLNDLNAKAVQAYMDAGYTPNSAYFISADFDEVRQGEDTCTQHPLTFLLNRDLDMEGVSDLQQAYEDLYHCGVALLGNPHADHSRIVYEQDHFGFTPADYAACSPHSELAARVIFDHAVQGHAREGQAATPPKIVVPDYFLLSLVFVSMNNLSALDCFISHADRTINRVVDELRNPDPAYASHAADNRESRMDHLNRTAVAWDKCRYQLDDMLRMESVNFEMEKRLEKNRLVYHGVKDDQSRRSHEFVAAFHEIRKDWLKLRPAS